MEREISCSTTNKLKKVIFLSTPFCVYIFYLIANYPNVHHLTAYFKPNEESLLYSKNSIDIFSDMTPRSSVKVYRCFDVFFPSSGSNNKTNKEET
jgi:hypothetical protein